MTSIDKLYQSKLVTKEEAISKLPKSGALWLHHAVMEPKTLVNELTAQHDRFEMLNVYHMVRNKSEVDLTTPGFEKNFLDNAIFCGANSRAAFAEGRMDYTPIYFHDMPIQMRAGRIPCDAVLLQVSPPDAHGYCYLGASVDYSQQAARTAKIVIAQVSEKTPHVLGDSTLHLSEIDYIIETDDEPFEISPPVIGDIEKSIGEHCASLVEDGCTMQLGIGGIPDAVILFLEGKKDLGVHSEMISDGTLALFEKGVINNSRKSENRGKITVTFLMGTKRLYDFAENNHAVEIRPVDYVNHPVTVMRQHKPVGINSAIEVDLQGQVVSEAIGLKQFSGVGGQVDFVRGCAMAEGGKSIIAIPSSTVKKDGTRLSKIVPFVTLGAPITTSRCDVDYVITENGIAPLRGRSLRQRAKALIEIAHPDFKGELKAEYNKRFID